MIRLGLCILVLGATVGFLSCGGSLSGGAGGHGGQSSEAGGRGGAAGGTGGPCNCDGSFAPVGGTGGGAYHLHAPDQHRAGAPTCSVDRSTGGAGAGGSPVTCGGTGGTTGQLCTGLNAICCHEPGGFNDHCAFDACATDADCVPTAADIARGLGSLGACACNGKDCGRNLCTVGNCRVDADCGSGMYCSLSSTACVRTYQCHTPNDECADSSDCDVTMPCGYDASVRRWRCITNAVADCFF